MQSDGSHKCSSLGDIEEPGEQELILRKRIQAAEKEILKLREQLRSVNSQLNRSNERADIQAEQLTTMSTQSIADAETIRVSDEQIKHQSEELSVARKALLLQAELEAANKELETFSYSVSHDLRSPLRAINGFAKALIEDYSPILPDEAKQYLNHIENSAVKMGLLIDDLLSFSRLSRLDMKHGQVDMKSLAQSVWSEVTAQLTDREIDFDISPLPKVEADRAMMRQVLINLLSNAAKFTGPQETSRIVLTHEQVDGEHIFCVKDNGVGFDERYTDKLFGPFQRLHKAKDFPGTGIGLALVQRIIHRHGGKVWARSQLGQGASFYFTLPIREDVV